MSYTILLLYYTILYYTILYYTILFYTILYYTILYYTILHILHHATPHQTTLHLPREDDEDSERVKCLQTWEIETMRSTLMRKVSYHTIPYHTVPYRTMHAHTHYPHYDPVQARPRVTPLWPQVPSRAGLASLRASQTYKHDDPVNSALDSRWNPHQKSKLPGARYRSNSHRVHAEGWTPRYTSHAITQFL